MIQLKSKKKGNERVVPTIGLMLAFTALIVFDFKKVWKKKGLSDKVVYLLILGLAFGLSELHIMGFHIIGLNQILDSIMKFVGLSA